MLLNVSTVENGEPGVLERRNPLGDALGCRQFDRLAQIG